MERAEPFLSVVVTTRNDDHGGDPLKRLQAFVNVFDAQCRRTGLDAELIVVEWNPPPEKPAVAALLRLPESPFCTYRFIEVPPELHQKLEYSDVLPLFQMIAKNVGIRRARGRFVLATNIDIIFSNELVERIARRQLQSGRLYRVDRHDIEPDFPVDAPLAAQMAYCQSHHLRKHERWGSHPVDASGGRAALPEDIVDGRTVRLGDGWHVREGGSGSRPYRWASHRAGFVVRSLPTAGPAVLDIELESNPYAIDSWVDVAVADEDRVLARTRVSGRARLAVALEPTDGGRDRYIDLRLVGSAAKSSAALPAFERRTDLNYRVVSARVRPPSAADESVRFECPASVWVSAYQHSGLTMTETADGLAVATDPLKQSYAVEYGPLRAPSQGLYRFDVTCSILEGAISFGVLSGDRMAWLPAAVNQHDHAGCWRFEIAVDLEAGQQCSLMVSNDHSDGSGASRFVIHRVESSADPSVILVEPVPRRSRVRTLWRRARTRVAGALAGWFAAQLAPGLRYRVVRSSPEFQSLSDALRTSDHQLRALTPLRHLRELNTFLLEHRPADLHGNGCGDFQLMAREHWEELRAYPEFETFSMNIDGLFAYVADAAGIQEEILDLPIYHLEHEVGSGWSPEGEALLRRRIAERGITWLDASTVHIWAAYMNWLRHPMIFNGPDWGLATDELPERVVGAVNRAVS